MSTPEEQINYSEYSLMVWCAWRVDTKDEVVCGTWDDNTPDGAMIRGLSRLVGQRVLAAKVAMPGLDLEIQFENNLAFRVFCDQVNEFDAADNYYLFHPGECFVVSTKSRLTKRPSEADPQ